MLYYVHNPMIEQSPLSPPVQPYCSSEQFDYSFHVERQRVWLNIS